MLDSPDPIPKMAPTNDKKAIQDMVNHSQMWHNGANGRRKVVDDSSGLAAITAKLDKLVRDLTNAKKKVHAVQVGCEICHGYHLAKDFPLKDEVQIKKVKYGEFYGRSL